MEIATCLHGHNTYNTVLNMVLPAAIVFVGEKFAGKKVDSYIYLLYVEFLSGVAVILPYVMKITLQLPKYATVCTVSFKTRSNVIIWVHKRTPVVW